MLDILSKKIKSKIKIKIKKSVLTSNLVFGHIR